MAKNMLEKKKRIAHNKIPFNLDHEMFIESNDLVASIMEGMDNNLPSMMHSNKLETNKGKSSTDFSQTKPHDNVASNNQSHVNVPKFKKLALSRKFPLMEKSQKALKQIRHNRKIPKPRAHLAGLSVSPSFDGNWLLGGKSKKAKDIKNAKGIRKSQNKEEIDNFVCSGESSSEKKIKKNIQESQNNASKQRKPHIGGKKDSVKKSCNSVNTYCEKSDNHSSDSEYERFIEKEKKDLPKKCKNQRDLWTKKQKFQKAAKNIPRFVSTESDSDISDEASAKPYYEKSKRIKDSHKILDKRHSIQQDNESEMGMVSGEFYHDSSSESDKDEMPSNSTLSSSQFSGQMFPKPVVEFNHNASENAPLVSNDQHNVLHGTTGITSLTSNDQSDAHKTPVENVHKTPNLATLVVNEQLDNLHETSESASLIGNYQPSVYIKSESFGVFSTVKNESVLNSSSKEENFATSLIVDLTESDNECNNASVIMPKNVAPSAQSKIETPSHSEESDIELVDVIVPKKPKNTEYPVKNVEPNSNDSNRLSIKTEVNETPSHGNTRPQNNFKPNAESQTSLNISEVVFATNICQENDKKTVSKGSIMKQFSFSNDELESGVQSNSGNLLVLKKKIKKEPCDDCEIILDTASTSNPSKNGQIYSNTNIKKEKNFKSLTTAVHVANDDFSVTEKNKLTEKEGKLHEVACSSYNNLTEMQRSLGSLEEKGMTELQSVDIKCLLKALKEEFATYQEIIHTEQSVEATFKLLERHQAEKLNSLRSRISKLLENSSDNSDNLHGIKNGSNTLLDSPELSSVRSLEDCIKMPSVSSYVTHKSNIITEDLKTFAAMNLVPLSSISETDIKPNVSELQYAFKQKASTSDEIHNMSFGEKCIVCAKDASAACQQCAKVFFCSNECGKRYWEDGHKNACAK